MKHNDDFVHLNLKLCMESFLHSRPFRLPTTPRGRPHYSHFANETRDTQNRGVTRGQTASGQSFRLQVQSFPHHTPDHQVDVGVSERVLQWGRGWQIWKKVLRPKNGTLPLVPVLPFTCWLILDRYFLLNGASV